MSAEVVLMELTEKSFWNLKLYFIDVSGKILHKIIWHKICDTKTCHIYLNISNKKG